MTNVAPVKLERKRGNWQMRCACGSVWGYGEMRLLTARGELLERHRREMPLCPHRASGVVIVEEPRRRR